MKRKIVKKWVALMLSAILMFGVFAVLPFNAVASAPAYASGYSRLVDWSGTVTNSSPFDAGDLPVKDMSAETYLKYSITPNASAYTTNTNISMLFAIAKVVYKDSDYFLAFRMTNTYGFALGLYPIDGSQSCEKYIIPWQEYPDTEAVMWGGHYEITVKTEGNSVRIWWGDDEVSVAEDDYENIVWNTTDMSAYDITVEGAYAAAYYNWNTLGYSLNASVWTTNANSNIVYNANDHVIIQSRSGSGTMLQNSDFETFSNDYKTDKTVYNAITVKTSVQLSGWFGPYIMLAEVKNTDDESISYLGLRLTGGNGYFLRIFSARDNGTQIDAKYDSRTYANGTNTLSNSNISIVSKVENGRASVWLEGINVASNLQLEGYEILSPVISACTMGYGYYLSYDSYVDSEPVPIYNPSTSVANATGNISAISPEIVAEYDGVKDDTKAIYNSVDVKISYSGGSNQWSGPYILLAETDYTDGSDDTWYLGIRFAKTLGYQFRLFSGSATVGNSGNAEFAGSISYGYYANGTQTPDSNTSIVSKVENGKMSLWFEGRQILMDFVPTEFNITKSAILASAPSGQGTFGLTLNSWVESENYMYLCPEFDEENDIMFVDEAYDTNTYQPENNISTIYTSTKNISITINLFIQNMCFIPRRIQVFIAVI